MPVNTAYVFTLMSYEQSCSYHRDPHDFNCVHHTFERLRRISRAPFISASPPQRTVAETIPLFPIHESQFSAGVVYVEQNPVRTHLLSQPNMAVVELQAPTSKSYGRLNFPTGENTYIHQIETMLWRRTQADDLREQASVRIGLRGCR